MTIATASHQQLDDPLAWLERVAARAGGVEGDRLATCLATYIKLRPTGVTFDAVLGLDASAGTIVAAQQIQHLRRNALIRQTAEALFPDAKLGTKARKLAKGLRDYARNGWKRDRTYDAPPLHLAGTAKERYFTILKMDESGYSARNINRILDISNGYE